MNWSFVQPPGAFLSGQAPGGSLVSRKRETKPQPERRNPLADPLPLERTWTPDQDAMLAALRVAAGLPRKPVCLTREDR